MAKAKGTACSHFSPNVLNGRLSRWRVDDFDPALQQVHAIDFDQRIQYECASSFSLAPSAMVAVHEEGFDVIR
jgi:hypothetical protein